MKYRDITEFARSLRKNPTKAEKLFWQKVRNRKFQGLKFNRQYVINYSQVMDDKHYFNVEFFCHEHKVIIELDGPIHKYQIDYDSARESILKDMGYTIIRFDNEVIFRNWEYVENEVMRVCGLKCVIY